MSASLVGSEMCIRDSRLPALRNTLQHLQRARASPGGCRPPELALLCQGGCLLYTSDAADDM
eukprot:14048824-Alexandrium_andersonii.AAC.1